MILFAPVVVFTKWKLPLICQTINDALTKLIRVTQFRVSWQQWLYMIYIIWGSAGEKNTPQQTEQHCQ